MGNYCCGSRPNENEKKSPIEEPEDDIYSIRTSKKKRYKKPKLPTIYENI